MKEKEHNSEIWQDVDIMPEFRYTMYQLQIFKYIYAYYKVLCFDQFS